VGPALGDAVGELALAGAGRFYAVGGALGSSGNIVSVSESGSVARYGRASGQVHLFGAGANITAIAAGRDGSVWLGADGGVLEHLLPQAPEPCVVPQVVGYREPLAKARLPRGRCLVRIGSVPGPSDTPAIVTAQSRGGGTVLNPDSKVLLTVRRGIPYACDPGGDADPELTVLRISCRAALHLYRHVYTPAIRHGSVTAGGFSCRYLKGTAIQGMGGGEVACRGRDRRRRLRGADMFYALPR
jgi:hypothetical protein